MRSESSVSFKKSLIFRGFRIRPVHIPVAFFRMVVHLVSEFIAAHVLAIYITFTAFFLCVVVALSAVLGPRRIGGARGRSMSLPVESGMLQTGTARLRMPTQYYLMAVFFVIFDVESVFLYAWGSVAVRAGWTAYVTVCSFIIFLAIALAYLWRSGALEWGPKHRRPAPIQSQSEISAQPQREV